MAIESVRTSSPHQRFDKLEMTVQLVNAKVSTEPLSEVQTRLLISPMPVGARVSAVKVPYKIFDSRLINTKTPKEKPMGGIKNE